MSKVRKEIALSQGIVSFDDSGIIEKIKTTRYRGVVPKKASQTNTEPKRRYKNLTRDYIYGDGVALTRNQISAIRLIAMGWDDLAISKKLSHLGERARTGGLAVRLLSDAMAALGARNRAHCVGLAVRHGFIKVEELAECDEAIEKGV